MIERVRPATKMSTVEESPLEASEALVTPLVTAMAHAAAEEAERRSSLGAVRLTA